MAQVRKLGNEIFIKDRIRLPLPPSLLFGSPGRSEAEAPELNASTLWLVPRRPVDTGLQVTPALAFGPHPRVGAGAGGRGRAGEISAQGGGMRTLGSRARGLDHLLCSPSLCRETKSSRPSLKGGSWRGHAHCPWAGVLRASWILPGKTRESSSVPQSPCRRGEQLGLLICDSFQARRSPREKPVGASRRTASHP